MIDLPIGLFVVMVVFSALFSFLLLAFFLWIIAIGIEVIINEVKKKMILDKVKKSVNEVKKEKMKETENND